MMETISLWTKAYINFKWNVLLYLILYLHFKELPCFDNLNKLVNFYSKYKIEDNDRSNDIETFKNLQNFDVRG